MFWFRSKAIVPLLDLGLTRANFSEATWRARDATIAHAIERSFLFFSSLAGFYWARVPRTHSLRELDVEEVIALVRESALFDEQYYLNRNPDVSRQQFNPVRHYCEAGFKEGRNPSAKFDWKYYLKQLSDAGIEHINPIVHFLLEGRGKGFRAMRPEIAPATIHVENLYESYKKLGTNPEYVDETFPIVHFIR